MSARAALFHTLTHTHNAHVIHVRVTLLLSIWAEHQLHLSVCLLYEVNARCVRNVCTRYVRVLCALCSHKGARHMYAVCTLFGRIEFTLFMRRVRGVSELCKKESNGPLPFMWRRLIYFLRVCTKKSGFNL